ncbi:hypothetical protein XM38_000620 [Halomicronema hongdechloris C2206]|uniref:DUF4268 domain-containing protein n=1 Tax=Halomicronema hongdechloris C2206 TaxID=1641165 RepID=A0A1Z3HFS7_9CYAN|nr:DUF4268 domain-containing protein [Halomicronema hongdechloris]ASC69136.1 hypothetical protein XM38_000620 [Halomicronema hongdechloris C2206]
MPPKKSSKPTLGRLEKLDPTVYWHEDAEIVPWLSEPENLRLLGEALGLQLAPMPDADPNGDEDAAHPRALLCQERVTGARVVIEPQLGTADDLHLGQLLTRAAQWQVDGVIWVVASLTAAHQQTLAWLNQVTTARQWFCGVELELWRIGKTAMAAKCNPVIQPTEASAAFLEGPEGGEPVAAEKLEKEPEPLTEGQLQNLEFWTGLCQHLDRRGSIVKPGAPPHHSAMGFAIGRAGFRLYASVDREHQTLHAELLLSGEDAQPHFYLLATEQDAIAAEMGYPLVWDDQADHKACAIYCTLTEVDLDNRDQWPDYYHWLCDCLEGLHEVFAERIKHLNATDYQPLPEYGFNPLPNSLILPN